VAKPLNSSSRLTQYSQKNTIGKGCRTLSRRGGQSSNATTASSASSPTASLGASYGFEGVIGSICVIWPERGTARDEDGGKECNKESASRTKITFSRKSSIAHTVVTGQWSVASGRWSVSTSGSTAHCPLATDHGQVTRNHWVAGSIRTRCRGAIKGLSFPRRLLQTSFDPERSGKLDLLSVVGVLRLLTGFACRKTRDQGSGPNSVS
jgi:hypothetical protein